MLDQVFDMFSQAGRSSSEAQGGLGIGLTLVKGLMKLHNGQVQAASDGEGKGATFVVKLPLIAVHPSSERKVHPRSAIAGSGAVVAPVDLRGARVLIVDDEPDARELLAQVLAEAGAEVVSAGTAQAGLDALAQSRPDVLVSDIGLPDADGYDFIRRARMRGESATTPALALTAFSSMEDRTRAMLAGYQMHLAKPVDAHEFLVTVASLCGRLLPRVSGRG